MTNLIHHPRTRDELKALAADPRICLGDIDTSAITDMTGIFQDSPRNDFTGIGSWDTSAVTCMDQMFSDCQAFNADISSWDTSKVTSMEAMFRHA